MNKRQKLVQKITLPNNKGQMVLEEEWDSDDGTDRCSLVIEETETQCIPFDKATKIQTDNQVCQGCELDFGQRSVGPLKQIWTKFEENRELPIGKLAELISDCFEQLVVIPSIESGGEIISSWSASSVETHLTSHMIDDRLISITSLKTLRALENSLKDRIHRQDGEIDHRAVASLLNCQKQSLALLHKLSDVN